MLMNFAEIVRNYVRNIGTCINVLNHCNELLMVTIEVWYKVELR